MYDEEMFEYSAENGEDFYDDAMTDYDDEMIMD